MSTVNAPIPASPRPVALAGKQPSLAQQQMLARVLGPLDQPVVVGRTKQFDSSI